jgi:arsenate reductase-like glutaredoxin family protein
MDVIVYHNPNCGTSRNTLGLIRKGVRLCRPSEEVLDLLPPQRGEFRKEDGELVVDASGRRAATA